MDHGGSSDAYVDQNTINDAGSEFTFEFPPHSVTALVIHAQ